MYKRIPVTTEGSTLSQKAVREVMGLATPLEAALKVLDVVLSYPMGYFEGCTTISPDDLGRLGKERTDKGQAIAEAAQNSAEAVARRNKSDLIVRASHDDIPVLVLH